MIVLNLRVHHDNPLQSQNYKSSSHEFQKCFFSNDILSTLIKELYHLSNLPFINLISKFLHILNQSIRINIPLVIDLLTFSSIIKELISLKKFLLKMCLNHFDCFVCHCFELQQLILLFAMSQLYDKQLFLKVKQKLDQLHLNYQFHIEDLNLIAKLITKIQEKENTINNYSNKIQQASTLEQTRYINEVQQALNMEIVRLIRENSTFRRNLWQAREQILDVNSRLVKNYGQKIDNQAKKIDQLKILDMKDRRERQLLSELEDIRYKYNQLMDLIHENPTFQREYIKRLLKRKKIVKEQANYFCEKQSQQKLAKQKNLQGKSMILDELSIMKSKLLMRQQQIIRMQAMIEDNNNYIIYRHQKKKKSKQQQLLKEEIIQLEKQNYELKMKLKTFSSIQFRSKNKSVINSQNDVRQKGLQKKFQKEKRSENEKQVHIEGGDQEEKMQNNTIKSMTKVLREGQLPSQKNQQNQYGIKDRRQKPKSQRVNSPPYPRKNPNNLPQIPHLPLANNKNQSKSHQKTSSKSKNNFKPLREKQTSNKEESIIHTYQKLLQQKNDKINQLQAQLKTSPSRSIKIISAQNINTNNKQTNNVIVKTNKNEYITINSPTQNEEQSQMDRNIFFMEQAYNLVIKQKEQLKEQILKMQKEKEQYLQRQKVPVRKSALKEQVIKEQVVQNKPPGKDQSFQYKQRVKQQLYQTQMTLIKTNQQNLQLQRRLNQLLLVQKNNPLSIRLLQDNSDKEIQHLKPDQALLQLQYLRRQMKRLKIQMQSLYYQRQVLLARLKQLQGYLNQQTYQMRFFQEHVFGQQESYSSYISEVKQLKNQSEVKSPF